MACLTYERLKEVLSYDKDTGIFIRNKNGKIVGSARADGSLNIMIDGKHYKNNRLAWFWMTGSWPSNVVDHIDRTPANNRWSNLREASTTENGYNSSLSKANKSGVKGVFWNSQKKKWHAVIRANGKNKHIGFFDDLKIASEVILKERKVLHGEFYCSGATE
jgi:hypothetical protein